MLAELESRVVDMWQSGDPRWMCLHARSPPRTQPVGMRMLHAKLQGIVVGGAWAGPCR